MSNPEIKEQAELKIEDLPEFEIWKIRDNTWSKILLTISYDEEELNKFIQNFDDIYYFSTYPSDIEKYKNNPALYEIIQHYKHTTETGKLELMIFKIKEISEEEKQKFIKELREKYWDFVKLDEAKYEYIVGYFWWTAWRTSSAVMKDIKNIYPVKTLK